jgi:hypothetical protein
MACLPLSVYASREAGEELKVTGYGRGNLPVDYSSHPELIEEPHHGLRPAVAPQVLDEPAASIKRLITPTAGNGLGQAVNRETMEIETEEPGETRIHVGHVIAADGFQFVPEGDEFLGLLNRQSDLVSCWFHLDCH